MSLSYVIESYIRKIHVGSLDSLKHSNNRIENRSLQASKCRINTYRTVRASKKMVLNVQNFRNYIIFLLIFVSTCKHFISSKHLELFKNGVFYGKVVFIFFQIIALKSTVHPFILPLCAITIQNI